ncbi:MAG TPA: sigma-70 family RNA polymerase sigma factor, partial [Polyangiaceae bacterium]|nr:sigma-70 family RNA polymerase sigma factor [Polyangiaceae bacterium]
MNVAGELRALYPRVLGKTLAFTRQLADAEDAVQDAIARALATWPETGTPESPEAWLVSVAMNAHRDRLRRGKREERHADALAALADMSPWVQGAISSQEIARGWKDDLLRLLFACCDPSLEPGEGAALALATVLGLTSHEIACAFDVTPRSMDQRLTRARRRLRERGDYETPHADAARDRLDAVLSVMHLLFNEGYWSSEDDAPIRGDLCRLAIGLGRSLYDVFAEPEVAGLLALMILHEARRPARLDAAGMPVPLPEQDRTRWSADAIAEGIALLDRALRTGAPGPYQIEAAISATHCRAQTAAATDWEQLAELYALLERAKPSPAVRINRAFAVARARGAEAGLALLDACEAPYADAVRGAL